MNIKTCWFCHTGVSFKPIWKVNGHIMHSLCRNKSCPMYQQDLTAIKLKQRKFIKNSKPVKSTTKRKSRFISGLSVGLISLICTSTAFANLNSIQLPSNEIIYQQTPSQSSLTQIHYQETKQVVESATSTETIKEKIWRVAKEYEISPTKLNMVIWNESHYDQNAKGDMTITCARTGKPVEARGLGQITKCFHPEITDEQAYDPDFAISWVAKQIAEKHCGKEFTTCRL